MHSNFIKENSIPEIQTRIIKKQLINEANSFNNNLSLPILQRTLFNIENSSTAGFPFFVPYLLNENNQVDLEIHNRSIRALHTDINTMRDSISIFSSKVDRLDRTIDRSYKMILSGINKVTEAFRSLRTSVGISRFSFKEEFASTANIDLSSTTAEVDTDKKQATSKKSNLYDGNIKIGRLNSSVIQVVNLETNGTIAVDSNFYDIMIPGNGKTTVMQVTKNKRERTEILLSISLEEFNSLLANNLIIRTSNKIGTIANIFIESNGESKEVSANEILSNSTYTFPFSFGIVKIDKIKIRFIQDIESNITEDGFYIYQFKLDSISAELTNYSATVDLISSMITAPFPLTDVSLLANDIRPEGTNIQYFVSIDKTNWMEIIPHNQRKAANNVLSIQSKSNSLVSIVDTVEQSCKTEPWYRLKPDSGYGNSNLYNILEYVTIDGVISGQLDIPTNYEILPESLKVYRGFNDYSVENLKYEVSLNIEDVLYRIETPEVSGDVNLNYLSDEIKTEIFTRIEGEKHTVNSNGQIIVNYNICNSNIIVIDLNTDKELDVLNFSSNTITMTGVLANTKVSVIYHTLLSTIESTDNVLIDIDPMSIKYKYNDLEETFVANGKDLIITAPNKMIKLNRNNSIPSSGNQWKTFYLTFTYTKKARKEFKLFRTYVYYEQDENITILPFTEEEIFAGNMHIIDGINVSRSEAYLMKGGLHEVITTQPFKCDPYNPKDINYLTGKQSSAGIVLGSYLYRRAYKKSMQQVSVFTLANVTPLKSNDAFALDNNKILFNFIPEYLPDNADIYATHMFGKKVFLKEALYLDDSILTFDEYKMFDEFFQIEYSIKPKDGTINDKRDIYIKASLYPNIKTHRSPVIKDYELLAF